MPGKATDQTLIQRNGMISPGVNFSRHKLAGMDCSQELPIIDRDIIADLSGTGVAGLLLKRVLGLFEAKVPAAVAEIECLSATEDRRALADAVHALKSICANIGALRAAAACDELEWLARSGADFDAAGGAALIAHEVAEAMREVRLLCAA
jgi:HPt (histidine-containing phosphotransfer) domain-containing protein